MRTITCTREFSTTVEPTPNVRDLAAAFGIGVDEDIKVVLYKDLEVKLGKSRIVYITGESGAGKSTLLRDIASRVSAMPEFHLVPDTDVRQLPNVPLVDQFGDWPLDKVGELLAYVGIAEPFIYLRKPMELSDGQRYRFKLARMIYDATIDEGRVPVICIDEFLAFLDRETARNVAHQTRKAATIFGLCFVVATTHDDIARDLQANLTITMRLNIPPELAVRPLAGL